MKNYVQKIVRRLDNTNPTKIRHSEMGDWGCITFSVFVAIVVCVFKILQGGGGWQTQNRERIYKQCGPVSTHYCQNENRVVFRKAKILLCEIIKILYLECKS